MSKFDKFSKAELLPLQLLLIDSVVQRLCDPKRVKAIAAEFDIGKLRPVAVSLRQEDGKYYVVDGQHGIAAAKLFFGADAWRTKIDCRLYSGLSLTDEAELFLALNNQKIVSATDKFRVGVQIGCGAAFEVNQVLIRRDLTVGGSNGIKAISALLSIHKRYGVDALDEVLRLSQESFAPEDDGRFAGWFLKGLARFVDKWRDKISFKLLRSRLEATTAAHILDDAGHGVHKSKAANVYAALVSLYDYKRPNKSRLVQPEA